MMADIFNNLDRQSESRFIAALEERNRESAERIKALMFTFDDLIRLTPQAVQVLLRAIEKDKLPVALKGASDKLRDMFFKNMSDRASKILKDDMEGLGRCGCAIERPRGRHRRVGQGTGAQGCHRDRRSKDEDDLLDGRVHVFEGRQLVCRTRYAGGRDEPGDRPMFSPSTCGGTRGGVARGDLRLQDAATSDAAATRQAIARCRQFATECRRPREPSNQLKQLRDCCWTVWRRYSRSACATAMPRCVRSCAQCCQR
jgi:hypothetical protein